MTGIVLPFKLETPLEQRIGDDPLWQQGVEWGRPRHGHPEGTVKAHIAAVLANVDAFYGDSPWRADLRLIALIHDTFKFQVDVTRNRSGENHHAMRARRFAERFLEAPVLLEIIELHDEAYNAWQRGRRDGKWDKATDRAGRLVARLGDALPVYLAFYHCDNNTEGKQSDCLDWFREFCGKIADDQPVSETR